MAFQVSPGVNVSEVDLTNVVPQVASTTGAFAGAFQWGPIEQRVLIDSELSLVDRFGKPDDDTATDFLTASSFLAYGNALFVARVANSSALNATSNTTGVLVKNELHYDETVSSTLDTEWVAKYPGALGNSLKVSIADSLGNTDAYAIATYHGSSQFSDLFSAVPGTSDYVSERGGSSDELHVVVIDEDGAWTGTAGTVLETYEGVSKALDAKSADGTSNYYKNVINNQSEYIWFGDHTDDVNTATWGTASSGTAYANLDSVVSTSLSGGADGNQDVNKVEANGGYNLFASPEDVDVSLLIAGAANSTVVGSIIDLAVQRKDCLAFFSPERADVVNNAGSEVTDIKAFKDDVNRDTSYAVMDSGWKLMFDKYNDTFRYVPLNGDVAGTCVRTDLTRDAWFSPAGFNRGNILNLVRLAYNPAKADRDQLYVSAINPVVTFPGQGTVLFGDKTLQSKPSAFDRINVRRLFIVLEKAISTASKFLLFEFNDEFTRAQFRNLVEPFLREVQGRRGITDFAVVCDETNNTSQVIDSNEFVGDIFIKPNRSINFIQLNFVAVRSGVEFSEITGVV